MKEKAQLHLIMSKFAHDMASPLGGLMMALDMVESPESQEPLALAQDSLGKMKATLTLWRAVFSPDVKEDMHFSDIVPLLEDFLKGQHSRVRLVGVGEEMRGTLFRLCGIMLLCISDRLAFINEGRLTLSPQRLELTGKYLKGDFWDRVRQGSTQDPAALSTRTILPFLLQAEAKAFNATIAFEEKPSGGFLLSIT